MFTTTRRTILVLGALVLLGGCAGELEPSATPSASATAETPEPSETAAPVPTPTPTPTASVVNGPNSIDSPSPGSTVTGPAVRVKGEGTAFEATLEYRVTLAGTGELVEEGWTMSGANGEVGPYVIELTLDPGEYTVAIWEPEVSDEESPDGPYRNLVEVTFTVS